MIWFWALPQEGMTFFSYLFDINICNAWLSASPINQRNRRAIFIFKKMVMQCHVIHYVKFKMHQNHFLAEFFTPNFRFCPSSKSFYPRLTVCCCGTRKMIGLKYVKTVGDLAGMGCSYGRSQNPPGWKKQLVRLKKIELDFFQYRISKEHWHL